MSWVPTELPDGPKISSFSPLLAGSDEHLRSRESFSASEWNTTGTTSKAPGGLWNTYASPLHTPGWNSLLEDPLSRTFPRQHGLRKTITGTGLIGSKRITGISFMATPPSRNSRIGTPAEKLVRFLDDSLHSAKAVTPSPAVRTSKSPVNASGPSPSVRASNSHVNASNPKRRPCPSYDRAVQQLQQRTSSPRLSDVGSDREADKSRDLSESAFLGSLASPDPFQVFTPRKSGSLPYVPRLDNPE